MADIVEKEELQQDEEYNIIEEEKVPAQAEVDDDDDDERIADQDDDVEDDREAIRERRRQEKKDRKDRRDQAIKRDKTELDFLRKRNDDLERRIIAQEQRSHQGDLSAYDGAIAKAQQEAEMAERIIARAVEAGNGEDVTQALKYRDEARQQIQQLAYQKQIASQQRPQPQRNQIDDMTLHYAKKFMSENPWYDVQGGNEDSAIVQAIDASLAKDGLDPRSEEYWDELRNRAAKRLPERFGKQRVTRGGPAVGSGKEHAPTSTRKEIYISPERKQALIDAGVWDDATLRTKYIKRYAEYDKQHKG